MFGACRQRLMRHTRGGDGQGVSTVAPACPFCPALESACRCGLRCSSRSRCRRASAASPCLTDGGASASVGMPVGCANSRYRCGSVHAPPVAILPVPHSFRIPEGACGGGSAAVGTHARRGDVVEAVQGGAAALPPWVGDSTQPGVPCMLSAATGVARPGCTAGCCCGCGVASSNSRWGVEALTVEAVGGSGRPGVEAEPGSGGAGAGSCGGAGVEASGGKSGLPEVGALIEEGESAAGGPRRKSRKVGGGGSAANRRVAASVGVGNRSGRKYASAARRSCSKWDSGRMAASGAASL